MHHSLYNKGLERMARHAEQVQQQSKERSARQVLGRSREYYWQMLDRQIRDAFDKAAKGHHLANTELEDFLRHFGVMATNEASSTLAVERINEESRKLRTALWRHLDPDGVGEVDFLTLQVFFWVLMVAVADESLEAQKLHNLARKACEEAGQGTQTQAAVDSAMSAAATVAPDGFRICELLMRFNPKQLRQEFKQLYLDRLHRLAGRRDEGSPEAPSRRSLSSRSRLLAERVHQKMQEEAGSRRHVDLLWWRQHQVETQRQRMREEKDAQEAEQCPFAPCLVNRRTRSVHGGLRLYEQATARQMSREETWTAQAQQRQEREMADCTFHPNVTKSDKSFHSSKSFASPASPRGADACAQRMRKAFAEKDWRRRFLEERAPSAVSAGTSAGATSSTFLRSSEDIPRDSPKYAVRSPGARDEALGELRSRSTWVVAVSTAPGALAASAPSPERHFRAKASDLGRKGGRPQVRDSNRSPAIRQGRVQPKQMATQRQAKAPTKGGAGAPPKSRPSVASVDSSPQLGKAAERPLLIAEVSISQDLPPAKLVLYECEDVAEVAANFAREHALAPHLAERLRRDLSELSKKHAPPV